MRAYILEYTEFFVDWILCVFFYYAPFMVTSFHYITTKIIIYRLFSPFRERFLFLKKS